MNMQPRKLVNDTPLPKLTGKFCVMRQSLNTKRMVVTCLHDDALAATEEAQRLNSNDPHLRFMVVKVITAIGP